MHCLSHITTMSQPSPPAPTAISLPIGTAQTVGKRGAAWVSCRPGCGTAPTSGLLLKCNSTHRIATNAVQHFTLIATAGFCTTSARCQLLVSWLCLSTFILFRFALVSLCNECQRVWHCCQVTCLIVCPCGWSPCSEQARTRTSLVHYHGRQIVVKHTLNRKSSGRAYWLIYHHL